MADKSELYLQFSLFPLEQRGYRKNTIRSLCLPSGFYQRPASPAICSQLFLSSHTDTIISSENYLHKIIGKVYRKRKKRRLNEIYNAVFIHFS